ncbi:MAG: hypothetical protein ACLP05_05175 [Candidatus Kryptoniota bacterium]
MGKVNSSYGKGKIIFAGIDVHKEDCVVTVVCEGEELDYSHGYLE